MASSWPTMPAIAIIAKRPLLSSLVCISLNSAALVGLLLRAGGVVLKRREHTRGGWGGAGGGEGGGAQAHRIEAEVARRVVRADGPQLAAKWRVEGEHLPYRWAVRWADQRGRALFDGCGCTEKTSIIERRNITAGQKVWSGVSWLRTTYRDALRTAGIRAAGGGGSSQGDVRGDVDRAAEERVELLGQGEAQGGEHGNAGVLQLHLAVEPDLALRSVLGEALRGWDRVRRTC